MTRPTVNYEERYWSPLHYRIDECRNTGRETIFCLGNGRSLREQNPLTLPDGYVLGCNRAWQWRIPDAMVFSDSARFRESCELGANKIGVPCFLAPSQLPLTEVDEGWARLADSLHHMVPLKGLGAAGEIDRLDQGIISIGGSVIFTALQVALWMRPKRIVLMGVDLDYSDRTDCYFYPHEPVDRGRGIDYANARETLIKFDKACKRRDIELINSTCGGELHKVLPYRPLEEL